MKWTDVVSAIAALLGVLVATCAGIVAWRAYKAQNDQLKQLKADKKQQLAAGFGVWLGPVDTRGTPRKLYYHNAGPLPVYGVRLHIRIGNENMEYLPLRDLGPTAESKCLDTAVDHIHTAVEERVENEIRKATKPLELEQSTRQVLLVSMLYGIRLMAKLFRDANGTEWIRETSGALHPGGLDTYDGYAKESLPDMP